MRSSSMDHSWWGWGQGRAESIGKMVVRVSTCWHPNQASLYTENSKDPINGAVHWKQHHCVNSLCFLRKSKREGLKALFLIDWKLKKVRISELKFQGLEFPYGHPLHSHSKAHQRNNLSMSVTESWTHSCCLRQWSKDAAPEIQKHSCRNYQVHATAIRKMRNGINLSRTPCCCSIS